MSKIEKSIEEAAKMQARAVQHVHQEEPRGDNVRFYIEEGNKRLHLDEESKRVHLNDYIDVLLRRKRTVIVFLISVVAVAAIASFLMTPLYKATTTVQLKHEGPSVLTFQDIYQGTTPLDEYYETQYNILKSKNLARRVIRRLMDTEVNPASESGIRTELMSVFGNASSEDDNKPKLSEKDKERILTDFLIQGIEVQPVKKSQLIKINFTSRSPEFASEAANTIADEYINFAQESKFVPTKVARGKLDDQVKAMRTKLETSERQLNDYIARSQIIVLGRQGEEDNTLTKTLSELSKELDRETANRISKEATYKEANEPGADYNFVLENQLIQTLKKEYSDLESKYFNLLKVFKPEYPAMLRLEKEIETLRNRIDTEKQKLINALESDYKISVKKENSLSFAIEKLRKDVLRLQQQMTQYQILKREADTNKELYTSLLTRLKEVDVSTTLSESNNSIQVLDRAEAPTGPFKPQKVKNIGLSIIVGLLGGCFLAFFMEYFDSSVRTAEVIEKKSQLPVIGMVPLMKANAGELVSNAVSSDMVPFAEAFRTIGAYIRFTNISKPPRQILITSPIGQDGKTTLAGNLAKSLIELPAKVIVVDADLRRPSVHSYANVDNSTGLSSFLSGKIGYNELIKKAPHLGVDFINAGPIPPNPSELLSSPLMRNLINTLSSTYEYLIIDSPPVIGMSDALILSTYVESVVVVVRAFNTPKDALAQAIRHLKGVNAKIMGIVLNGLDVKRKYGYSYYPYRGEDKTAGV
ncbi:MAG: polysaccharide biosynthesis tyrosine autokinase [Nitrospirae bacterium]|nr:polysaccharide biosynthesis tyrosine autokinase [Nitrospirota bacterium]